MNQKRFFTFPLIFSMLVSLIFPFSSLASVNIPKTDPSSLQPKSMLICFKNKVNDQFIIQMGGKIKRKYKNFPVAEIEIAPIAKTRVLSNSSVSCLEENGTRKLFESDNTTQQYPDWGIDVVKAPQAWNGVATGKGIRVGVIDSGIARHPDLVIKGGATFIDENSRYQDYDGHGTHVAGIIGAKNNDFGTVGVAPDAELYAIKVCGYWGCPTSAIIGGLDWAITNKMHIVNLSLGGSFDFTAERIAIETTAKAGIIIVCAAGNSGDWGPESSTVGYPARYPQTIAVAALQIDLDKVLSRAYFSSTGNEVDIAAPGNGVFSTYLNNGYEALSGTSMAAPYVTGLMALWKQAYPNDTPQQLRQRLENKAIDLGDPGIDRWYGHGLALAPDSLTDVKPTPTASPTPKPTPVVTAAPTVEPIVTPNPGLPVDEIFATVSTKWKFYTTGESVSIQAKATADNAPLADATMELEIESPDKKVVTSKATSNASGQAIFTMRTTRFSTVGEYKLTLKVSKSGLTSATATSTFKLNYN